MNKTSAPAARTATAYAERVALFTARVAFYVGNGVGHEVARERAHADVAAMVGAA